MTNIVEPNYVIWIRDVDTTPLVSRDDPTQVRANPYNPNTFDTVDNKFPLLPDKGGSRLARGFKLIGIVKNYEKLEFKTRYNNVGGWTLLMQDNTNEANILKTMCYGTKYNDVTNIGGYGGILVVRNGKNIFSGPVRGFEATGDFYSEHGPMVTFYGYDDTCYLNQRIICNALPSNETLVPAGNPPYSNAPYTGVPVSPEDSGEYLIPSENGYGGGQGFNYFAYPSTDQVTRVVPAVIRNTIQFNIGVYAPYINTYPLHSIQPFRPADKPPLPNNPQAYTQQVTSNFISRRIPFLFLGSAPIVNHAYVNLADSDQIIDNPKAPNYRIRGRYNNLLEKIQEAALYTIEPLDFNNLSPDTYRGYQFSINQEDIFVEEMQFDKDGNPKDVLVTINGLRFNYQEPRKTENEIIFSQELENIGSYKYNFDMPKCTVGVVGGQGQSDLRFFFNKQLANLNRYGFMEMFKDRRDIQYGKAGPPNTLPLPSGSIWPATPAQAANFDKMQEELNLALSNLLRENGPMVSLEIEALNTKNTIYNETYFVGDFVTVVLNYQKIIGQVTDVTVTLTKAEGEVVKPTIGTNPIGDNFFLFDQIRNNKDNIENLDTSY